MPLRKLKGLSGSQNEADEVALILSKRPRDQYQVFKNMYGSDYADRWLAKEKAGEMEKEKQDLSELEAKVKEEREHNDEFQAQIKIDYEIQHNQNKIKDEESGYQTI